MKLYIVQRSHNYVTSEYDQWGNDFFTTHRTDPVECSVHASAQGAQRRCDDYKVLVGAVTREGLEVAKRVVGDFGPGAWVPNTSDLRQTGWEFTFFELELED